MCKKYAAMTLCSVMVLAFAVLITMTGYETVSAKDQNMIELASSDLESWWGGLRVMTHVQIV